MTLDQETPNPVLREFVTSGAFSMTLSRSQLAVLTAIWHNDRAYMASVRDHVTAFAGLRRRGLVYHTDAQPPESASDWDKKYPGEWAMKQDMNTFNRLTRAGEIMGLLLIEAGLLTERKRVVDKLEV